MSIHNDNSGLAFVRLRGPASLSSFKGINRKRDDILRWAQRWAISKLIIINFEIAQRNSQRSSAQNVVAFRINPFKGLVYSYRVEVPANDYVRNKYIQQKKQQQQQLQQHLHQQQDLCLTVMLHPTITGLIGRTTIVIIKVVMLYRSKFDDKLLKEPNFFSDFFSLLLIFDFYFN